MRRHNKEPEAGGTGDRLKGVVILLIALDFVSLGAWGYLNLIKQRGVKRVRKTAESSLMHIKRDGENVSGIASRLSRDQAQDIENPMTLINRAAKRRGVLKFLRIQPGVARAWNGNGHGNHDEVTNNVGFREKRGFAFEDLIRLMTGIESQNPKVQIKNVNFGKRDEGEDCWHPINMVVRTFKPR